MENLLDLIIPLIFVATFVLNSVFKSDKNKDKGKNPTTPPIKGGENDTFADLREEIRRRVEENRRNPQLDSRTGSPEHPLTTKRPEHLLTPRKDSFDWATAEQEFLQKQKIAAEREEQIKRKQAQVVEMRRRAEQEALKAARIASAQGGQLQVRSRTTTCGRSARPRVVAEVIRELRCAESSRKAVLNAEILGTPVGMRRSGSGSALWEA